MLELEIQQLSDKLGLTNCKIRPSSMKSKLKETGRLNTGED